MRVPTFRTSDGAELSYEERGSDGPRLLFVHGWQGNRSVWRAAIDALPAEYRTVSVDLRGSGDSESAPGPYTLERFAADLRELIESLGIAPVVLVGHSMGGTVVLRLAVDAPELTRGIVLIAPVPASGGGFSPKGAAYLRATAGNPDAVRGWLTRTILNPPDEATLDFLCAAAAKAAPDAALASFESWAYADFADETKSIVAPALVIAPEHDAPDTCENKVAALLPNARFAVLPHSAHYANVERPHEVARLIQELVAQWNS